MLPSQDKAGPCTGMTFAQRVAQARATAGHSYRKLGDLAGMSRMTVYNLENGISETVYLSNAIALADALNVSRVWLLLGEGTPTRKRNK
jgi:transcriptional regulator with XRE-family HTH domain